MAVHYWRGGASSDPTNVNNWVDASETTSASAPTNNDTLIFDRGNVDCDGDIGGLTGLIVIGTPGYTGTLGHDVPFNGDCASVKWKAHAANFGGSITAAEIESSGDAPVDFKESSAHTVASLVTINTDVYINGNITVTTCRQDGGTVEADAGTAFTLYDQQSGKLITKRNARIICNGTAIFKNGALWLDNSEVRGAGLLDYYSGADIGSGHEIAVRRNGKLTFEHSPTTFNAREVNLWRGAKFNKRTQAGDATVTLSEYGGVEAPGPMAL